MIEDDQITEETYTQKKYAYYILVSQKNTPKYLDNFNQLDADGQHKEIKRLGSIRGLNKLFQVETLVPELFTIENINRMYKTYKQIAKIKLMS